MKKLFLIIIPAITILLSGCNPNEYMRNMMDRMAPDEDEALAHEYLDALRSRDFDTATRLLDPQFNQPGIESNLTVVADVLDKGDVLSLELVGCNVFSTPQKRRSNLTYQYQFADGWVLAALTIDTVDDHQQVFGINVNPTPKSLGELNAFTFKDKSLKHYFMLVASIGIPLFILFVLVICIRTKVRKKKWLWIIFILLGLGKLGLNWSTGQILFNPFSFYFQLLGSGIVKQGLYAPWIITISLPLGAILFLIRKDKLTKQPEQEEPNQELQPTVKTPAESGNVQGTAAEL